MATGNLYVRASAVATRIPTLSNVAQRQHCKVVIETLIAHTGFVSLSHISIEVKSHHWDVDNRQEEKQPPHGASRHQEQGRPDS
jgi:hypothetical protein